MIVIRQDPGGDSPAWTLDRNQRRVPGFEGASRTAAIETALRSHPSVRSVDVDATEELVATSLAAVHDRAFLDFLAAASEAATPEEPVLVEEWAAPGVSADTPVCAGSNAASRAAVATALTATHWLDRGADLTYALGRPPGHHAGPRWMGGYCYLNSAATAAASLAAAGSVVGVLDIDFHFGNGTAAIAAGLDDVWLESIHASTVDHFPWRQTAPHGDRQRFHQFDRPPSSAEYLMRLDESISHLQAHCDVLAVSLGYDILWGDPHGDWSLPPAIFTEIGRRLTQSRLPTCVIQEGGYSPQQISRGAYCFAKGVANETRRKAMAR